MRNPLHIDLFELEEDERFRAAYLRFLQLANTYVVQIFFQTFNDGKRRKRLYEWMGKIEKGTDWKNGRKISTTLYRNIVPTQQGRSGYLDAYDADFSILLQLMDASDGLPGDAERFYRNLDHFHAIPLGRKSFVETLDLLRDKRNWLKDFARRRNNPQNRPDDTKVIRALGLLLLPRLHQHFIGEVRRAVRKARRGAGRVNVDVRAIEFCFRQARRDRAESTRRAFGTRKRGRLDRKLRRDAEQAKQAFMKRYEELYPEGAWPRYSYHQFRIRLAFIGHVNLNRLLKLLRAPEGRAHFSRDVEPLYNAAMAINNILDEFFWRMQRLDKQEEDRLRNGGLSRKDAKEEISSYACLQGDVRELRNHVAHNGLFCFFRGTTEDAVFLPVVKVFEMVFRALARPHNPRSRADMEELYGRIRTVLKKQDFVWVFDRRPENEENNPPIAVRRWTERKRSEYLDFDRWRLDRRKYVRGVFSRWLNSLDAARKRGLRDIQRGAE